MTESSVAERAVDWCECEHASHLSTYDDDSGDEHTYGAHVPAVYGPVCGHWVCEHCLTSHRPAYTPEQVAFIAGMDAARQFYSTWGNFPSAIGRLEMAQDAFPSEDTPVMPPRVRGEDATGDANG